MLWARVQVRTQTHSEKEWWDTGVSCEKWQPSLWSLFLGKTQSPPSHTLCLSGKCIYCGCVLFLSVRKSDVRKRRFCHFWEMTTDGFLKSEVIMIVPSARGVVARWNSPQTNTSLPAASLHRFCAIFIKLADGKASRSSWKWSSVAARVKQTHWAEAARKAVNLSNLFRVPGSGREVVDKLDESREMDAAKQQYVTVHRCTAAFQPDIDPQTDFGNDTIYLPLRIYLFIYPSSSCRLIVVEGFACPSDPRSPLGGGLMPLARSPRAIWFSGRDQKVRLKSPHDENNKWFPLPGRRSRWRASGGQADTHGVQLGTARKGNMGPWQSDPQLQKLTLGTIYLLFMINDCNTKIEITVNTFCPPTFGCYGNKVLIMSKTDIQTYTWCVSRIVCVWPIISTQFVIQMKWKSCGRRSGALMTVE